MKAYWTDKRANGQPIESGTFARVIDLEDGTHPQWVYGKTQEEVWQKIELNNMHAQQTLARRAAVVPPAAQQMPARMTADERAQAMVERDDPAKAGAAMARLIRDDTGFDPAQEAMNRWYERAAQWERDTPAFYPHDGNRKLLGIELNKQVGGQVALITKQMLDNTFARMLAAGDLFEAPVTQTPPDNLETFPGQNPVQRVERPRGARFATHVPGTRLGAPQIVQPKTLKYTKEQILRLSTSESARLIKEDDPDYAAACELYFGTKAASA